MIKVRVGENTVEIHEVSRGVMGVEYGETDGETILINKGLDHWDAVETLLHELFHVILMGGTYKAPGKTEEQFVDVLGKGLAEILKDNPTFNLREPFR